ncbi:hypothetical protein MauCBS54593_006672 [Microsporum audouinii]
MGSSSDLKDEEGTIEHWVEPNETAPSTEATVTNDSMAGLQSIEQRDLMNLVDRLRRAGLSSVLQLPQIVVCGDQSSGKSSVLEAITEIPFPRKENLCTRFATEIIMRRDAESAIHCKINPDNSRDEEEQADLRKFSKSIQNFTGLPSIIDDATAAMGLNERTAFSRDVLSVEICGPDLPQLTLVDLPGLIHSANKSQSDEDVDLIKSLVEGYISQERTIILAVISAKNDYANQVILKNCRKFDPKGARTLGVVTKPDYLRPGSENEGAWLDLVRNRDIYFELGWHLLKNRSDDEHQLSFAERNSKERAFFNAGRYGDLPQSVKGIDTLRQRLSELLFHHLKRELPILKGELDRMASTVRLELQPLGKSRATLSDQRAYLADFFGSAYELVVMGLNGNYEGSFFGAVNIKASIDGKENSRRLRAVVQHLNVRFAEQMNRQGHKYHVEEPNKDSDGAPGPESDDQTSDDGSASNGIQKLSRKAAVRRVVHILERSRGREIPGTFNPMLTSHLFWEQSEGWQAIAQDHINRVAAICRAFLLQVLEHSATPELRARILSMTVTPALKTAKEAAFKEIESIEEDRKRHPITYNHYFTDTLQKIQGRRSVSDLENIAEESTVTVSEKTFVGGAGYTNKNYIEPATFRAKLANAVEENMDRFSAEQALDTLDAYYKTERKYFIDVIAKQVVERHLVAPLIDVFAPRVLARYSDKQIKFLASETPETVRLREHLENRSKILNEGQEAFYMAMGQGE